MAITQLGLNGPQAAYLTFEPKSALVLHHPVLALVIYAARVTDVMILGLPTESA